MITKRLLRFALGPSFLTDDDPDYVAPPPLHKQRSIALYDAQTHILRSLGVYAGQLYRLQGSQSIKPRNVATGITAETASALQKDEEILEARKGRYMILLGTFFFFSSAVGSIAYDLKTQIMALEDAPSIRDFLTVTLRKGTLISVAASLGVSLLTEVADMILGYCRNEGPSLIQSSHSTELSIGLSFLKEFFMYPFRELQALHSLRLVNPLRILPSKDAFKSMFTSYRKVRNTPLFMVLAEYRTCVSYSAQIIVPYFFKGLVKEKDPLFDENESEPPSSLNLAALGASTFAKTIFTESFIGLFFSSLEQIAIRLILSLYLAEHVLPNPPALAPSLFCFSLQKYTLLVGTVVIEWSLQYALFEALGGISWVLEKFNII